MTGGDRSRPRSGTSVIRVRRILCGVIIVAWGAVGATGGSHAPNAAASAPTTTTPKQGKTTSPATPPPTTTPPPDSAAPPDSAGDTTDTSLADVNGENGDQVDGGPINADLPTTPPVATTIPIGCDQPIVPQAVIEAKFTDQDAKTTRFTVVNVRSGSIDGFGSASQVDIDFGADRRFLILQHTYLIAVSADPVSGALISKLKIPPPSFGGNQVIGVDDRPNNCPKLIDPILTTEIDGKAVDTGMLSGLKKDKREIATSFLWPALAVFGVLVVLVLLKHFSVRLWRGIRRLRYGMSRSRARTRRMRAAR
jgi:hypothetical protein